MLDGRQRGGQAVAADRVGPYRMDLGRTQTSLTSCEDEDMFKRLLATGARGFYRPDLIIHHYVAPERVSRNYFRRWCFWRGVSLGILDRQQPQDVAYAFGVPRYMFGIAARAAIANFRDLFARRDPARRFANELAWWDLIGFIYGRHWARPAGPTGAPSPRSKRDDASFLGNEGAICPIRRGTDAVSASLRRSGRGLSNPATGT